MRAHGVILSLVWLLQLACGPRDGGRIGLGGTGGGGSGGSGVAAGTGGGGSGVAAGTGGGGMGGSGGEGGQPPSALCVTGVGGAAGGAATGGSGGSDAGAAATGGSGGRGLGGVYGTAGAGGGIPAGVLYPCPEPPPNTGAACPNDSVTCTYPSLKSCACYSKAWVCADCPTSQPTSTDNCGDKAFRLSMSCSYGNTTCSCERRTAEYAWHCGICPPVEPLSGDLCGNVPAGLCRYGADTCSCGSDAKWSCATATCPANPTFTTATTPSCTSKKSAYTCRYAESDQDCICLPNSSGALSTVCSCPANLPPEGGQCVTGSSCSYGDVSCTCSGTWRCRCSGPPNPCPTGQPSPGGACSVRISTCAYGSTICACDGTSWSCA